MVLRFLSRLVSTRIVGLEQIDRFPNVGFAHWHGDEIALLPRFGYLNFTVMVSHSWDGERMALAAQALGYRVVRGSSTRGAVGGLLALIKAVQEGHGAGLAVDGPRGPRGVCKPGIIRLAQKTGVPLLPTGVAVSRKFVFKKTWNQVYLPLPFSRQVIYFDEPLFFSKNGKADAMEGLCRQVEEALHLAHNRAERMLQNWRLNVLGR